MNSIIAINPPEVTALNAWVKTALEANKDRPDEAARWLADQSDKALINRLVILGAQQIVRTFYKNQRVSALTMATGRIAMNPNSAEGSERLAVRLARVAFWDAYTLFGMTPIREATRDDLIASAEARESQARGEMRSARFERAVADKLGETGRVCETMTTLDVEAVAARVLGDAV